MGQRYFLSRLVITGWCGATPEGGGQDNEVVNFALPGRLVWEEDARFFVSREAGSFKSLVVQAVLLWSCIPISQNQGRERLGCGKIGKLTELLDGISVVGQWLLVVQPRLLWRVRAPMNLPRFTV